MTRPTIPWPPNGSDGGDLIVREQEPLNLEMPFSKLNGFTTPNESFYVRCHFPIPEIAVSGWRLKVEGEVEAPFELNYEELLRIESETIPATLECAGNNRIFLEPKVKGVQWALGAVGNASWTGVPLSALLARAKIKTDALEVILEGADEGEVDKTPRPSGKLTYSRSLPLSKACDDVLLAYEMNGERLSAPHGFPVRAIVPGWYAMASVKWLRRLIVTSKPFNGYYQSLDYTFWDRSGPLPTLAPLRELQVKAQIARPENGEIVPLNSKVRVHGAAWSGDGEITKVEVSADAGATWQEAALLEKPIKNAWRLWQFDWHTPSKAGTQTLMARATDSGGHTQSFERNSDRGTYMINHLLPVVVEMR